MKTDQPVWNDELLAAPHGTPDKARRVREMFNGIAPRYELVNSIFSFGRDAAWRRKAVRLARVTPADEVLDIACGTGDLARAFHRAGPRRVIGCDFAHEMLMRASKRDRGPDLWCEADALSLPFADATFSIVSCAFGVRNFQDLAAGLREMSRVLRPGGRAIILEFTMPRRAAIRWAHNLYAQRIMPVAASWISGDRNGAYRYLPRSVETFPSADGLRVKLRECGFARADAVPMTMGIVTVYVALKDSP